MTRLRRDFTSSAHFHLINHAVDSQDLFALDRDFELFEAGLSEHLVDAGMAIHAYALMSNHFHLLVDASDCDDPSAAVGELQSRHAKRFNRRTGRRGPLFEPRFLSYGVAGSAAFHRVTRYIHANPVPIAGRRALAAYRWSSLPIYLGRRPTPDWFSTEPLASEIDQRSYLASVQEVRPQDLAAFGELPPLNRTTMREIECAVDHVVGPASGALSRRGRLELVAMLGLDLRAADVVDIANHLGRSPSTVRRAAQRCRTERMTTPSLESCVDKLLERLAMTWGTARRDDAL